jgi:GR25 family glycosyltransferase involved in LPS biosynthesis
MITKNILYYLIIIILHIIIINILLKYNNFEKYEQISNIYDKIDIIYYINLENRIDRRDNFIKEMEKNDIPKEKIKRINAIKHERGEIGCSQSHIKVLKEFIDSNYKNCIIFEDDFEFIVSKEIFISLLEKIFNNNINYDIIMLSGNITSYIDTEYNFLKKVLDGQTSSGYLISKKFASILLENLVEGEELLRTNSPEYYEDYGLDQYWKKIQPYNNWYVTNPKIGKQCESYSDILNINVNYNI